ncbi:MAG: aminopeptidase P family protein [Lachnospira sp.]|nr:aminopeptidase P family protein [Lachnospira sp.]
MPVITDPEITRGRLMAVRENMRREGIDVCVVTTDDFHQSEYSGAYFQTRRYLTGFTGSAGTLVLGKDDAALFTDGRYFLQAALQIKDTGITLMKMGQEGVPDMMQYLAEKRKESAVIGFDGRTVAYRMGERMAEIFNGHVREDFDPVRGLWEDRPPFPENAVYELPERFTGESRRAKLTRIRSVLQQSGCGATLVASLDDIAWTLNLRGDDVACNPVFMAYLWIGSKTAVLFAGEKAFSQEIREKLAADGIALRPYSAAYEDIRRLAAEEQCVLLDPRRTNFRLFSIIAGECGVYQAENPSVMMKAVKNDTEIACLKDIHADDGVAVFRFSLWLKDQMRRMAAGEDICITELDAAEKLDSMRARIPDFIELSFPTISAYGVNGAQLHYAPTKENCARLRPEGMLLIDSGGQYYRGTTDITRTWALGPVSEDMKRHFTLTLAGMLALGDAHFLKGVDGYGLDILARAPLWNEHVDYRCGTGHGVGFCLNVHEAPNGFRWHRIRGVNELAVQEPGMITSDEPGVYVDGKYGIRIENLMLCEKDLTNEYGTWLRFRFLTMVPIDRDLIDKKYLRAEDLDRLNAYHRQVYETLAPKLTEDERAILAGQTAPM